jgi:hypothetical protein
MSPEVARNRHGGVVASCLLLGENRKWLGCAPKSQFDPSVITQKIETRREKSSSDRFKSKTLVNLCVPKRAVANGLFYRGGASSSFHTAKTQKRQHPDEAQAAGRSAIPCYPTTPIDFIEEARPFPRRVLRSPSGGPSTSSGPCAIFKRSGLALGCPRVAQCMDRPALGDV